MPHATPLHFEARTHTAHDMQTRIEIKMLCSLPPSDLAFTCEKTKQRKAASVFLLLSSQSLLPPPFVPFWIERMFASVITALAKWSV